MTGKHTAPIVTVSSDEWWQVHVENTRRAARTVAYTLITVCAFAAGVVLGKGLS